MKSKFERLRPACKARFENVRRSPLSIARIGLEPEPWPGSTLSAKVERAEVAPTSYAAMAIVSRTFG